MKEVLLVGYGNILRGDDGLGPFVAESFERSKWPLSTRIHVMSLPQLDLSMVAQLHDADVVIFVDVRQDDAKELLLIERLIAPHDGSAQSACGTHSSHCTGIPALLAITAKWYGKAPLCYLVQPKGFDFSMGAPISEKGLQAGEQARQAIHELLWEL